MIGAVSNKQFCGITAGCVAFRSYVPAILPEEARLSPAKARGTEIYAGMGATGMPGA